MDWRIVQYNPLSLLPCGRLRHILQEVGLQHFVGIVGTGRKASSHDPPYTSYKCGKYLVFDFPVRPGSIYPHKCAGVIIAISTQAFTNRNVARVVEVPAEFSGRVAAVRVRRSDVDFFFLSVYVPTEPRTMQERQRVGKLWAYIGRFLDAVPAWCVPILCLDANGRVGSHASAAVGHADCQRENWNGQQLREFCERHHLCLVNNFFNVGPTYRGEFCKSRIDYIAIPSSLLPSVKSCAVFHCSGQRLQKIATPGWRDHRPLHRAFAHKLCYQQSAGPDFHGWNSDLLVRGVLDCYGRETLLHNVPAALQAQSLEQLADVPPGPYWRHLTAVVRDEATKVFGKKAGFSANRPLDTQQAFDDRALAMEQLVQISPMRLQCDFSHLHDLHRVLKAWSRVVQFWKARKRHEELLKRDRRVVRSRQLFEFHDAWTGRHHARMWKAARSLAHRALGPKRRRYDVPIAEQPSAQSRTRSRTSPCTKSLLA